VQQLNLTLYVLTFELLLHRHRDEVTSSGRGGVEKLFPASCLSSAATAVDIFGECNLMHELEERSQVLCLQCTTCSFLWQPSSGEEYSGGGILRGRTTQGEDHSEAEFLK